MFFADLDRTRRLLTLTASGDIATAEVKASLEGLPALLADVPPMLQVLTDLSGVKSMSTTAAPYIGQIMDLCGAKGVQSEVRVLPAEAKNDIGFAIMSRFHYGPAVRTVTCDSLDEAARLLAN